MTIFPLEFSKHIIFCIISVLFFVFQYFRQGFKYQLMTAGAIGGTLLLYVSSSTAWRNTIGIIEAVMIILIFVVMSSEKKKAALSESESESKKGDTAGTEEEPAAEESNGN